MRSRLRFRLLSHTEVRTLLHCDAAEHLRDTPAAPAAASASTAAERRPGAGEDDTGQSAPGPSPPTPPPTAPSPSPAASATAAAPATYDDAVIARLLDRAQAFKADATEHAREFTSPVTPSCEAAVAGGAAARDEGEDAEADSEYLGSFCIPAYVPVSQQACTEGLDEVCEPALQRRYESRVISFRQMSAKLATLPSLEELLAPFKVGSLVQFGMSTSSDCHLVQPAFPDDALEGLGKRLRRKTLRYEPEDVRAEEANLDEETAQSTGEGESEAERERSPAPFLSEGEATNTRKKEGVAYAHGSRHSARVRPSGLVTKPKIDRYPSRLGWASEASIASVPDGERAEPPPGDPWLDMRSHGVTLQRPNEWPLVCRGDGMTLP